MSGIVDDILESIDDVLSIRNDIGAEKKACKLIVRQWSGERVGDGSKTETSTEIYPAPWVVEYKADSKVFQGGVVRFGDIMLKHISKRSFTDESELRAESSSSNKERFYEVGGILYQPVNVLEDYVYWNVHLRRLSDQRR